MTNLPRSPLSWALVVLLSCIALPAQRGGAGGQGAQGGPGGGRGFGPSEAILGRMGTYFVDVTLSEQMLFKGMNGLAETTLVKSASKDGHLSLLYLFDPRTDKRKHENFESLMFRAPSNIAIALRYYKCGRVDLSQDEMARGMFGKKSPMFVAFNEKGKVAGNASMKGYKGKPRVLVALVTRAAKTFAKGKVQLPKFVKQYRNFLNDYMLYEGKQRTLQNKMARLAKKGTIPVAKKAKLDKDTAALVALEKKLLKAEKKLLDRAKLPVRDEKATRIGDRRRGRR